MGRVANFPPNSGQESETGTRHSLFLIGPNVAHGILCGRQKDGPQNVCLIKVVCCKAHSMQIIIQLWVHDVGTSDQEKQGIPTVSFRFFNWDKNHSKW